MNNKFPKDILDAMKECILSLFWSKKEIIDFLKNNGCSNNELRKIDTNELARYQIIDCVFDRLQDRSDKGIGQFRSMLNSLIHWDYFNSYYFEKLKKLDKNDAKKRISKLKDMQEKRDQKIKKMKKEREEKKAKDKEIKTKDELKKIFFNLWNGKNDQNENINQQKRGYLFEEFLMEMFKNEKIEVKEPFKIVGEQVDGAIKFDKENYIIEAKWKDKFIASESLYQFAYKIDGKFYGRGLFISINGFSDESVRALKLGKSLNCILIDGADLVQVLDGYWTLKEMLDKKIQGAQTKGEIYLDVNKFEGKIK